jgi:site-specific recombinase XerD
VQQGVDLAVVRELMGHSDIRITTRYAKLAPEHRAAAVAKLVGA